MAFSVLLLLACNITMCKAVARALEWRLKLTAPFSVVLATDYEDSSTAAAHEAVDVGVSAMPTLFRRETQPCTS